MGAPYTRAGRARGREPAVGGGAGARNLAISPSKMVSPLALSSHPVARLRAVAHAHRVRRPRCRTAGEGHCPLCAVGGEVAMIATPMPKTELAERIKAQAFGLGFDLAGIARLGPADTAQAFGDWIARGYAGDMHYLPRWADKRRDTRLPFPGTVSAIVVAMDYGGKAPSGPVARYARGDDYHEVMTARLDELHEWIAAEAGHAVHGKAYVDTGPLLERDLARRAGLGWFGKNTNLVNPELGSFFFLGALLVDVELDADEPFEADRCGSCTRCLDACPTGAFVGPRQLDATRCVSYLTIELKGEIPGPLRAGVGDRVYGCDVCQDVCPW